MPKDTGFVASVSIPLNATFDLIPNSTLIPHILPFQLPPAAEAHTRKIGECAFNVPNQSVFDFTFNPYLGNPNLPVISLFLLEAVVVLDLLLSSTRTHLRVH